MIIAKEFKEAVQVSLLEVAQITSKKDGLHFCPAISLEDWKNLAEHPSFNAVSMKIHFGYVSAETARVAVDSCQFLVEKAVAGLGQPPQYKHYIQESRRGCCGRFHAEIAVMEGGDLLSLYHKTEQVFNGIVKDKRGDRPQFPSVVNRLRLWVVGARLGLT